CTCPMDGHRDCVIVEGDESVKIDGKAVAFDGHKTSCGAALISSLSSSGLA
ncbi:PAAR domain-containing protein, partial [Paraburkholderia xenovorans]|uniref:PAAR domain-containing protein n=1 Tax=Paraburkholderia xenovorans TaxID=36873 RepID=UPI0038B88BFE